MKPSASPATSNERPRQEIADWIDTMIRTRSGPPELGLAMALSEAEWRRIIASLRIADEAVKAAALPAATEPYGYCWFNRHMEQRFTRRLPHPENSEQPIGEVTPVYKSIPSATELSPDDLNQECALLGDSAISRGRRVLGCSILRSGNPANQQKETVSQQSTDKKQPTDEMPEVARYDSSARRIWELERTVEGLELRYKLACDGRRIAEARVAELEATKPPSSIGLTPKEGHCLLQVPQQTTEKPSPCAMAGYCLNTDAKAMPSATGRTLEEALHRCADYHGDDALLDAPCIFCGYNGAGYWQKGTHSKDCRLSDVGGFDDRRKALLRREQSDIHGEGQKR